MRMCLTMNGLRLIVVMLIASVLAGGALAADSQWYVRKGAWDETMFASREALASAVEAESEQFKRSPAAKVKFGPWFSTKPVRADKGLDTVLAPDKGADPTVKTPGQSASIWRKGGNWPDGKVINLGRGSKAITYVFRTLKVEKALDLPVWLGCNGRLAVRLNGKVVFTGNTDGSAAAKRDKVLLPLSPGDNKLLVKIYNPGRRNAFYFHTKAAPNLNVSAEREKLWALVLRDCKSAEQRKQISLEMVDRLWDFEWDDKAVANLAARYVGFTSGKMREQAEALGKSARTSGDLVALRKLYAKAKRMAVVKATFKSVNFKSLRLAIEDLTATYPETYGKDNKYLRKLDEYEKLLGQLEKGIEAGDVAALTKASEIMEFSRNALLANPQLDFDKIMVVRRRFGKSARRAQGSSIGAPGLNAYTNDTIRHSGWDNEVAVVSDIRNGAKVDVIFKPAGSPILRDTDLDFDGKLIMFSSITSDDRWGLFEIGIDGKNRRQLTPTDTPDVDFFDSCYLPDGRVVTCSTAGYQGLPCVGGGSPMVNLYLLDGKKDSIRQLTFEQDSDFHPCVLNNGRILYTRWEYSDIPHYFSRIMFSCNPDGTNQMEYWGSGSHFPTAFKHARPMPGHPRKIVGIMGGHHATAETGRMGIIDPALGRKYPFKFKPTSLEWGPQGSILDIATEVLPAEKTGFVQEIPGYGKDVVGNVRDGQGTGVYPSFVYPYPLSDKYILVSMKPTAQSLWGLYLVDIYDNVTLLYEQEGAGIFEPFPFVPRSRPPAIADRIIPGVKTANVYITDVYNGPGLAGIPRGKVKKLRLFSYHFAYNRTGGHTACGVESSWDIKCILGTVPVEADGSASFTIPANTPLSIQPLDEQGKALQIMRSWLVGKPGENVSCGGCHENQNQASRNHMGIAAQRAPVPIEPFYGPARPFSFQLEIQPVLSKYCLGCHDGKKSESGQRRPVFTGEKTSYNSLHPYVRRPGPESDMEMAKPMEWHSSTSPLVRMLEKGHHNVKLDAESLDKLYCWIDLNAPYRGSWNPPQYRGRDQSARRAELAKLYADVVDNPEDIYNRLAKAAGERKPEAFIKPEPAAKVKPDQLVAKGFPMSAEQARQLQQQAGKTAERELDLGAGQKIKLVLIPAGEFVMGSQAGYQDEQPRSVIRIEKPFWMSVCEISNAQYNCFDPEHDTRYYDEQGKDLATPGYIGNHPNQPVARVSWQEAMAFCKWLGDKAGQKVALPSEAQWEWAARAGSAGPFYYGDLGSVFSTFANLADHQMLFTWTRWDGGSKVHIRRSHDPKGNYPLRDDGSDDKCLVTNYVGQYQPNAWGLKDMVGNVSEWTRSSYRSYPYAEANGRNDANPRERKVARGGSWEDRPVNATASARFAYEPYQKVYNVGIRIVIPAK